MKPELEHAQVMLPRSVRESLTKAKFDPSCKAVTVVFQFVLLQRA